MNLNDLTRWFGRLAVTPRVAFRCASWGLPAQSLVFGPLSLGDDLLCTTVLREARLRDRPLVMFSQHPELFSGNTDPVAVRLIDNHYLAILRQLGRTVISPYYATQDPANPDRDILQPDHILATMCRLAGLHGEIALRPYLHLTPSEVAAAPRLPKQLAIQSSAAAAALPYANKDWGHDRFAELSRLLATDFSLVQIGSAQDPALPGVTIDLRGRTSLRAAAAVQAASLLFVGLEGFLTHLARAVDCPAVVILGGRSTSDQFGYAGNIHLGASAPCSPCGLRNTCAHRRSCLRDLAPATVAAAVHELAARARSPLPVTTMRL